MRPVRAADGRDQDATSEPEPHQSYPHLERLQPAPTAEGPTVMNSDVTVVLPVDSPLLSAGAADALLALIRRTCERGQRAG